MSRARLHCIVALLLPLLALKALLPPGYMPSAGDGQLRIVMCSAGLAAITGGGHGEDAPPGDPAPCAFAIAGVVAPPPFLAATWLPLREAALPLAAPATSRPDAPPRRYQAPRGPPISLIHV